MLKDIVDFVVSIVVLTFCVGWVVAGFLSLRDWCQRNVERKRRLRRQKKEVRRCRRYGR